MKKSDLEKLSSLASIGSFILAAYFYLYPQILHVFSVGGVPQTIDSTQLIPLLLVIGIIMVARNEKRH